MRRTTDMAIKVGMVSLGCSKKSGRFGENAV